jgi:hypothetical protein
MASDTEHARWAVINSNNKRKARINTIKYLLDQVDYPDKLKKKFLKTDKKIVLTADDMTAAFDHNIYKEELH